MPNLVVHLTSFNYDGKGARNVGLTLDVIWAILCLIASAMIDGGRGQIKLFLIKGVVRLFTVSWKRRCSFITLASLNVYKT